MSLALTDVWFRYRTMQTHVLQGVSLEVGRGESVAVMGPSGRGKSTLLGVAGLILKAEKGEVRIDGHVRAPSDGPGLLGQSVGWILQTVSLLPRRGVVDNAAMPLLAAGWSRREARREAARRLDAVGIDPEDDRQARTLSGGEAQRVGVARALAPRPVVLLADEPTANLDAKTAALVGRVLFAAARDTALVVATHDEVLGAMADQIVRLGDPVESREQP